MKQSKKDSIIKKNPLTVSAMQTYAHHHSIVIQRQRSLLEFELDQVSQAIINLGNALASEKKHHADLTARIEGLTTVLAARGT